MESLVCINVWLISSQSTQAVWRQSNDRSSRQEPRGATKGRWCSHNIPSPGTLFDSGELLCRLITLLISMLSSGLDRLTRTSARIRAFTRSASSRVDIQRTGHRACGGVRPEGNDERRMDRRDGLGSEQMASERLSDGCEPLDSSTYRKLLTSGRLGIIAYPPRSFYLSSTDRRTRSMGISSHLGPAGRASWPRRGRSNCPRRARQAYRRVRAWLNSLRLS